MTTTYERQTVTPLAYRAREAAQALGISERTSFDWTQAGDVPHVRRGKITLYPIDQLREWLARQAGAAEVMPLNGA